MAFPYRKAVPYLTTEQMIEVDRAMTEDMRIDLVQMMENAGHNLAHLARKRFLDGRPRGKTVVSLAGTGGNGGGALVAARHLANWGARVRVYTTKPYEALTPVAARQLEILRRMRVPVMLGVPQSLVSSELIIDGIIGYRLTGAPRGSAADLIRWANAQGTPILALDVPSGVDASTGTAYEPSVRAVATLALALPKEGLRVRRTEAQVGELYLADISVPPALYAGLGITVDPLFAEHDIVRLR